MSLEKSQPPNKKMSVIKQIREGLGMNQEEFAVAVGVRAHSVYRWETGLREPNFTISQMQSFEKLLKKLGLKLSDLPSSPWGEIPKLRDRENIAA